MSHLWSMLQSVMSTTAVLLPSVLMALSSLAVGLTPYPKAGTVLSYIMKVLNLLSLVVHADSPGSLKMPLTQSKDPYGLQKPGTGPVGVAFLPWLVIGSLFIASCACSNPSNVGKWYCKAESALINCSEAQAQPAIQAAMQDVEAAVTGNAIDWIALARAEASYGIGIVACVLSKLDAAGTVSHARVQEYMLARKLHLKK